MTEMIERAAKAAHEVLSRANVVAYLEMPEETATLVASAVIAAMREPTDAMQVAGRDGGPRPTRTWYAMIDTALAPRQRDQQPSPDAGETDRL